jgi:nucleoid-associated protein YgaU
MAAPTDASCPVCEEPLTGRPERCFRCETPLARWWEFEAALDEVAAPAAPAADRRRTRMAGSALMVMACGVAAVLIATRRLPAPVALAPAETVALPAPVAADRPAEPSSPPERRPATLSYRVQRGDSLWRIAASLTGDGRRWRELWPEHAAGAGRIAPGTVLEVELRQVASQR